MTWSGKRYNKFNLVDALFWKLPQIWEIRPKESMALRLGPKQHVGLLARHVGFRITFIIGGALVVLGILWLWRSIKRLQVSLPPASASCV